MMLTRMRSVPLILCSSLVVTLLLYYVAVRARMAQQQQQQQIALRDKLIQQRDDVARTLNDLQVIERLYQHH